MSPSNTLENAAIARVLTEIADLLELRGDNAFKIRAYRNAVEVVSQAAERVAGRTEEHSCTLSVEVTEVARLAW